MDSVCDGAGPREPSKVCQAEIKCVLSADTPKKEADNPAITEPQKEVVDAAPASLESSRKDAESVPDERTKAKVPKPGKTFYILTRLFFPFNLTDTCQSSGLFIHFLLVRLFLALK